MFFAPTQDDMAMGVEGTPVTPFWQAKIDGFFGHCIGHEGQGSLLSALKSEGLATGLSAGELLYYSYYV
jgi:hypothetical protein